MHSQSTGSGDICARPQYACSSSFRCLRISLRQSLKCWPSINCLCISSSWLYGFASPSAFNKWALLSLRCVRAAQEIIKDQKNENQSGISLATFIALPIRYHSNLRKLFSVAMGMVLGLNGTGMFQRIPFKPVMIDMISIKYYFSDEFSSKGWWHFLWQRK